jgi:hypothetical protein
VFSEELAYFCTNSLRLLTVVLSIYISSLQTAGKSKDALGFSKTVSVIVRKSSGLYAWFEWQKET